MNFNHSEITQLIANNKQKQALSKILTFVSQNAIEYTNEVISHQSKLTEIQRENRLGILSRDDYRRDISKLTFAILELSSILDKNSFHDNSISNKQSYDLDNIMNLYEKICDLYPLGIQQNRIWERSKGNVSFFNLNENPKSQWWDALKMLKNKNDEKDVEQFIREVKKDYPNSL